MTTLTQEAKPRCFYLKASLVFAQILNKMLMDAPINRKLWTEKTNTDASHLQ